MEAARLRCTLDVVGGPSRRVDRGGVLIGRQGDCDLVASDPSVSRRHALVRLAGDAVELVPLGRGGLEVNGVGAAKPRVLADGDRITLPGLAVRVSITAPRPDRRAAARFVLERARGGSFGISHSPFLVGGDEHDDVIFAGWPARALAFHAAGGELFVEAARGAALRNGAPLPVGALVELAAEDRVAWRAEELCVRAAPGEITTSLAGGLPRRIEIELLPRGGRVTFTIGELRAPVYLADRRLDLVMALARPPEGHAPGDFLADATLGRIVWPRKPSVSRSEINMLISRCRRDLVDAGLAGPRLIERAPGGGGTRLALARGAEIVVQA